MAKTSEPALGLAVMRVLASRPGGQTSMRVLIKRVPDHIALTDEDREPSSKRAGEEMWEQRVRNLKSHATVEGNILGEGLIEWISRGNYRLTEAGWSYLKQKS